MHLDVLHQGPATLALVPVKIGGKGPYAFVLDTGASISGINANLATKLKLAKTGKSAEVSGVTASARVPLVSIRHWSVGGAALHPGAIGELNFPRSGSGSKGSPSILGLLGSDQLSRFGSITVDYGRQQLRFTPGAK